MKAVQFTAVYRALNGIRDFEKGSRASAKESMTQREGVTELQVDGTLRLHGVENLVTVPVQLRKVERNLTADGELPLLQSSYGIAPIKVGGAAVRVRDKLKISFHIVAEPLSDSEKLTPRNRR